MTGSALITFIATILVAEGGVLDIDLGSKAGLRPGDRGTVFYEFSVGDQIESVDIGAGLVIEALPYTAKLSVDPDLGARSGFLVRFDLPRSRITESTAIQSDLGIESANALSASPEALPPSGAAFVTDTRGSCLNLRQMPAASSRALACLPDGTRVTVTETVPSWKKARLADGREGWLASSFLAINKPGLESGPAIGPVEVPRGRLTAQTEEAEPVYEDEETAAPTGPAAPTDLAADLEAADARVRELTQEILLSQAEVDAAERDRKQFSRRLLSTTVADLESRLAIAYADLDFTENERLQLTARINWLAVERKNLEAQLEESISQTRSSEAARQETDAELARTHAELAAQTAALAEEQRRYKEQVETTSKLEQRLESAMQDSQTIQAAREQTTADLASTRAELENASAQSDLLRSELATAKSEFARIEAEREQLTQALDVARSELVQAETQAEATETALEQEIRRAETTLEALHSRLEAKEDQLADTQARLELLEGERQSQASGQASSGAGRKSELVRKLELANLELQEAAKEKKALETWLEERGEELARAEARVAIMQSEIDRLEATAPSDRREIEGTRAALKQARQQTYELERSLAAKQQEAEALRVELGSLRQTTAHTPQGTPRESNEATQNLTTQETDTGSLVVLPSATPCLNLRTEPKLDGESFDCLAPGTRLGKLGTWDSWHYIELVDGRAGWVSSQHVGPASPSS